MKKLLVLILFPFCYHAQTDTIFKKDKKQIICSITFINNNSIFYTERKDPGKYIDLGLVSIYSLNGKRTDPSKPENKIIFPVQTPDTISVALELDYMKTCFRNHGRQYYTGVITVLSGFAVTGGGTALSLTNTNAGAAIAGIGAVVTLVGTIIMVDSHKWIRRAGLGINGKGNSVGIYYRFN